MSLRLLQFGATGQVAREVIAQAKGVELESLSRAEADLTNPAACAALVRDRRPEVVILSGAYTAVDQAESDAAAAYAVNAETPAAIAEACTEVGAALVWFSTDYVFPGDKGEPYGEDDAARPLSVYGASKLAGERGVLAACPRAVILRTSWVVSAHGKNFVKTILRVARSGGALSVVDDQLGKPTAAGDLAAFVLDQAPRIAAAGAGDPVFGVFHFANAGETSWHGFAQAIVDAGLGDGAVNVAACATTDRPPTPAARPARGTLDTTKLERVYGVRPRPWREPLAGIVAELMEQADAA